MRKVAILGGIRTIALQEIPADSNLGGIVLVHARLAAVAGTCIS